MKRKLKPLHVILSENEYELDCNSAYVSFIKTRNAYHISHLAYYNENILYPESFLEPIPEQEKEWFIVASLRKNEERPYLSDFLYRSKEDFLNSYDEKESDYKVIKLFKLGEGV